MADESAIKRRIADMNGQQGTNNQPPPNPSLNPEATQNFMASFNGATGFKKKPMVTQ